jgi:hypothetical protein
MSESKPDVSEAFLPALDVTDLGGLDRELAWLGRRSLLAALGRRLLKLEELEDVDSDGVWYGFPIPNSAARLIDGTEGVGIVLIRGGGGRDVSGPLLGLRDRSLVSGGRPFDEDVEGRRSCEVEGRRNLSGLDPDGADGVRIGGSTVSLGRGNVSERFGAPKRSDPESSALGGGPNPP